MNNFKHLLALCAFAVISNASAIVPSGNRFGELDRIEQCKKQIAAIILITESMDPEAAACLYIDSLMTDVGQTKRNFKAYDWTNFITAAKNHDANKARQEVGMLLQKILNSFNITMIGSAACLACVEMKVPGIVQKINAATAEAAGLFFTQIENTPKPAMPTEENLKQFIADSFTPAIEKLFDSVVEKICDAVDPVTEESKPAQVEPAKPEITTVPEVVTQQAVTQEVKAQEPTMPSMPLDIKPEIETSQELEITHDNLAEIIINQ